MTLQLPAGFSSPFSSTTTWVFGIGSLISGISGAVLLAMTPGGSSLHAVAVTLLVMGALVLALVVGLWSYFKNRDEGDEGTNRPRSLREQLDNLLLRLWPEYQEQGGERDGSRWRWLLVLGSEGAGKTCALSAAGFERVEIPAVSANGAPVTENHLPAQCRWWRHGGHRLIALEIEMNKHGRMEHARFGRNASSNWRVLLKWLRRHRLVDAIIVQVGIDRFKSDLERVDEDLRRSTGRLDRSSKNPNQRSSERLQRLGQYQLDRGLPGPLRAVVDSIRYELLAEIPIYLVFSHCDTMAGFLGFFASGEPTGEPWGISLLPPERPQRHAAQTVMRLGEFVDREFWELRRDLETRAIHNMTRGDGHAAATALTLPSELGVYADPIRCFIELFANLRTQQRGLAGVWDSLFRPASPLWLCNAYLCAPAPKADDSRDWLSPPQLLVNAGIQRLSDHVQAAPDGYFVGFFSDIVAGLQQTTWIRLPRPLFAGLIPLCLASAVSAFFVARFYHKELEWLRNLEIHAKTLQATQTCEEEKAVKTRMELISELHQPESASFRGLNATAQQALRQNIEKRCLLPRLKRLADEHLKVFSDREACDSILPDKRESALAYQTFQSVAILNRGLPDICAPLSTQPAIDLPRVVDQLSKIQEASLLSQKQQSALREQLLYYFEPALNDVIGQAAAPTAFASAIVPGPEDVKPYLPTIDTEILRQASCVAKRLQKAPPENIFRIWSGKGHQTASGLVEPIDDFYTEKGCREFAQILDPRWIHCLYDPKKQQGTASPQAPRSNSNRLESDYAVAYRKHWQGFVRDRLWTFPGLTTRSEAWQNVCKPAGRDHRHESEYWELDPLEVNEVWKQLHEAIKRYRERLPLLAQAVPEGNRPEAPICLDSEKAWLPLQVFAAKSSSYAAVSKYLAKLESLQTLLSQGLNADAKTRASLAKNYVTQTLGGTGLSEVEQAREALLAMNDGALLKGLPEELRTPMEKLEREVWLVLLRLSAQDIGQSWQDPYASYQEANNRAAKPGSPEAKESYDFFVNNLKVSLKGYEDKLKVFCSGSQPIRNCQADVMRHGARLVLASRVQETFKDYDHFMVEKKPELPALPQAQTPAPAPAAEQAPAPAQPAQPALRPLRVESLNCAETDRKSLAFNNYVPNVKPGLQPSRLICDRQDEKTWICPTAAVAEFSGEGSLALFSLTPSRRDGGQEILIERAHLDVSDKCRTNQIQKLPAKEERYTLDIQTDHPLTSCNPTNGDKMMLRITFAGHCSAAKPGPPPITSGGHKETVRLAKLPYFPACPLKLEKQ